MCRYGSNQYSLREKMWYRTIKKPRQKFGKKEEELDIFFFLDTNTVRLMDICS